MQSLALGYTLMILLGAALLMLPISSSHGTCQPFIDAFFTSTSAVTTTGLVVVDTGSYYSLFGQLVILTLIQVAGLGYMIFFVVIIAGLGGKLSFTSRMQLRDSMNRPSSFEMIKFAKLIILFTFVIEITGGITLGLYWMKFFNPLWALYSGLFHSISGFCTAGFGLFPDNFISYSRSLTINLVVGGVCLAGAIGFFVMYDIYKYFKKASKREFPRNISVHTKFVFVLSVILISAGALIIYISESSKSSGINSFRQVMDAFFQSISASSTAGFNSVNIGAMTQTSLFTLIVLMFIGASPGSTGAGIKTTTFGIMLLSLIFLFKGKENVNIFKKRISPLAIRNSFAIGLSAVITVTIASLVLTASEKAPFLNIFFEVVSALSNVGLSAGITPNLTVIGKIIISIVMFIGRVGPLAIGFSLVGKSVSKDIQYADAEILVG